MIASATGSIPLSPLIIAKTMVRWKRTQWLRKKIVQSRSNGRKKNFQEFMDKYTGHNGITEIILIRPTAFNTV